MSFASVTVTDEGDYYCCIVEIKDLDNLDNLTTLYENKALFSSTRTRAEAQVSAESFEQSIVNQGGELIDDSDIKNLGLHYSFGK